MNFATAAVILGGDLLIVAGIVASPFITHRLEYKRDKRKSIVAEYWSNR